MIIAVKTIEQQEKEWEELLADYADLQQAFAEAPSSWQAWEPNEVTGEWWTGQWATIGAAGFIWMVGSPVAFGALCSGPLFGPAPPQAIVGAVVTAASMVAGFAGFFASQKRATPWQPVREVVEQESAVGSVEQVRETLADTQRQLQAGELSSSQANAIMKLAAMQAQVADQGGGWLAAPAAEAKGPVVKRWRSGRGWVRVQRGGKQKWVAAEVLGWSPVAA